MAAIQNTQNDETTEERFPNGVCHVDNVEANRLQIFFPEIPSEEIRASLRSWEEGCRSPNSHTAAILEKFLLDHPTVKPPKK